MIRRYRLPLIVFFALIGLGAWSGNAQAQGEGQQKRYDIHIGKYRFEPNHIIIPMGRKVTLRFTSLDVPHAVTLKGFGISKRVIEKDHPVEVEITGSQPGIFKVRCTKYCGLGHLFFRRLKIEVQ